MDVAGPRNKTICIEGSGNDCDRISSLPNNLIEHILTFLPLREAAKTSVLSTAWRRKWVYRPSLVFNNQFWKPHPVVAVAPQLNALYPINIDKLMSNVLMVLNYHRGPLREFSLSIPQLSAFPAHVDRILLSLYDKCIESLFIWINEYKVPRCLFSFGQLKKLCLYGCAFTSSQISFDEFSMLTSLDLRLVRFLNAARVYMVIGCPLLLTLTLTTVDCGTAVNYLDIRIEAPTLSCLHCVGRFSSLRVKYAPRLKDVTVRKTASVVDPSKGKDEPTNFMKLCGGCPALERLSIALELFRDLGTQMLTTQPGQVVMLLLLKKLSLDEVCLSCPRDVWRSIILLQLAPNLQELIITTKVMATQNVELDLQYIMQVCGVMKHTAGRLVKVEINQLQGARREMCFIQWLLAVSPELHKMEIKFSANSLPTDQIRSLRELNGFRRASSKAQIII